MGVILGSGVAPIALCITWSKANKWGCIGGAIAGFVAGIVAWLVTTSTLNHGVINVVVCSFHLSLSTQLIINFIRRVEVCWVLSMSYTSRFNNFIRRLRDAGWQFGINRCRSHCRHRFVPYCERSHAPFHSCSKAYLVARRLWLGEHSGYQ